MMPGMSAPHWVHFFVFMQFWGEIGQNNRVALPSLRLTLSPLGNPGSGTAPFLIIILILNDYV